MNWKRLDPLESTDVHDLRFVLGLAHGIQAVAILGPLQAHAIDIFAGKLCAEGACHLFANHA